MVQFVHVASAPLCSSHIFSGGVGVIFTSTKPQNEPKSYKKSNTDRLLIPAQNRISHICLNGVHCAH